MKNKIILVIVAALILLLCVGGLIPCGIKFIFGIPCPSCGITRAYLSLFKGDIGSAFLYHPLFWALPAAFIGAGLANKKAVKQAILVSCGILFIAVYIIRMITLFPDVPPMDFSHNAILIWIIERIF